MKPMLCAQFDPDKVVYPLLASPKLDGVRAIVQDGRILSRSGKPLPNPALIDLLLPCLEDDSHIYDLELYDHTVTFQEIVGSIMSKSKSLPANLKGYLIDCLPCIDSSPLLKQPFDMRYGRFNLLNLPSIQPLEQITVFSNSDTEYLFEQYLQDGFEGLVLREPAKGYKEGRATPRENWLWKLKAFEDHDAMILEVLEGEELRAGYDSTDFRQEAYQPSGTLGSFRVVLEDGTTCKIGTWKGLSKEERDRLWKVKDSLINQWISFRSQTVGVKDKPRIPKDLRFRDQK